MTAADWLRVMIIVGSGVVAVLWVLYGLSTHQWLWPVVALCWLVPVMMFFVVRYLFSVPVTTLNLVSLSLYLIGVSLLGGVAAAKLRAQRLGAAGTRASE